MINETPTPKPKRKRKHGNPPGIPGRKKGDEITYKMRRFCEEYLIDMNGTQAAIRAGYAPVRAKTTAIEMMARPKVVAYLDKLRAPLVRKLEITRERVLAEYAKLAFFDIRKMYNENGTLKEIHELDDESAAAVAGLETEHIKDGRGGAIVGELKRVKLTDKRAALDSIAKMLGFNEPDKIKVAGVIAALPANMTVEELERLAGMDQIEN